MKSARDAVRPGREERATTDANDELTTVAVCRLISDACVGRRLRGKDADAAEKVVASRLRREF